MQIEECVNIDELFDKLTKLNFHEEGWYFRGQPNANFSLTPSLWRQDMQAKLEKFKQKIDEPRYSSDLHFRCFFLPGSIPCGHQYNFGDLDSTVLKEWQYYCSFENYLVNCFYYFSNLAELKLCSGQVKTDTLLKRN